MRALKSQAAPESAELVKLERCASTFLKYYVRLHCAVYADLLHEIKDTKVPPKPEPKEGEEPEEEDEEIKEKRKRNAQAKDQLAVIQASLFSNFILLSQRYAE